MKKKRKENEKLSIDFVFKTTNDLILVKKYDEKENKQTKNLLENKNVLFKASKKIYHCLFHI